MPPYGGTGFRSFGFLAMKPHNQRAWNASIMAQPFLVKCHTQRRTKPTFLFRDRKSSSPAAFPSYPFIRLSEQHHLQALKSTNGYECIVTLLLHLFQFIRSFVHYTPIYSWGIWDLTSPRLLGLRPLPIAGTRQIPGDIVPCILKRERTRKMMILLFVRKLMKVSPTPCSDLGNPKLSLSQQWLSGRTPC